MTVVPAGTYRVGIDHDEAWRWCREADAGSPHSLGGKDGWIVPMRAALLPIEATIEGFAFGRLRRESVDWPTAAARAARAGGRLITETEWEIAERHCGGIGVPGRDEWCADLFMGRLAAHHDGPDPGPDLEKGAFIAEIRGRFGRHTIRGRYFPVVHPCLRFHGAGGDEPFARTGYRVVYPITPEGGAE